MATNYTVHDPNRGDYPAPALAVSGQALALDTTSEEIIGPCELWINPDEPVKIDIRRSADAGSLDPSTSPFRLEANKLVRLPLQAGLWKFQTTAASAAADVIAIGDVTIELGDANTTLTAIKNAVEGTVTDLPRGRLYDNGPYTLVPFDQSTAAAHTLIAAGAAGVTHKLHGLLLTCAADVDVTLSGNATVGGIKMRFGQGVFLPLSGDPYYVSDAATALTLTLGSAVGVSGVAYIKSSVPA